MLETNNCFVRQFKKEVVSDKLNPFYWRSVSKKGLQKPNKISCFLNFKQNIIPYFCSSRF